MTFGVTSEGFNGKRLADVLSDAEIELATIVDPDSGESLQPDFSSDDPAMQVALVPLVGVADAWESSKLTYDQFNPSLATGPSLAGLVQMNGISQQEPISSTDTAELSGTPGSPIAAGQIISDEFITQKWITDEDVILDAGGLATVGVTNEIKGPTVVSQGVLTRIITPLPGWQTVSNNGVVKVGRDEESPADLRIRRARSTLAPAAAPAESVWANLRNLDGVTYVRVYINNKLTVDSRGIAPKTQFVVIVGGDDAEIAKTILQRSGGGVEFAGASLVIIYDAQFEPYFIRFSRPAPVEILIEIEITVTNQTTFPGDGAELIELAIIAYALDGASSLDIVDGFRQDGFGPGSNVIRSRLYTPINSIPGHKVEVLKIGTSIIPVAEQDVQTGLSEFPEFLQPNINVVVHV